MFLGRWYLWRYLLRTLGDTLGLLNRLLPLVLWHVICNGLGQEFGFLRCCGFDLPGMFRCRNYWLDGGAHSSWCLISWRGPHRGGSYWEKIMIAWANLWGWLFSRIEFWNFWLYHLLWINASWGNWKWRSIRENALLVTKCSWHQQWISCLGVLLLLCLIYWFLEEAGNLVNECNNGLHITTTAELFKHVS